MQTVLLTLVGPTRSIDLRLPAEVPIKELFPKMLELCAPPHVAQAADAQWCLIVPSKGVALPPIHSLRACGVVDGTILLLQDRVALARQQQQAQSALFRPQALTPSANTGGIGVRWNMPNH